jgi:hypothetical protein
MRDVVALVGGGDVDRRDVDDDAAVQARGAEIEDACRRDLRGARRP